ncbi:4-(cytidine 5'-diphospho)-2-C-methyl-D-erythritol kinase [Arthrobacter antibioticus]|uniref:4-(cytidine 5'-diphospho)-2-C-methyl-D-erythritol kinase n=1 Tax=Arthrobacter sp. H35-MC1 TaxID=3046203 RepID=UPI0024BAE4EE|nr:4-(cytidine 5'-diphospho)-2-C-methyl-D-erythritol kinase [Arthrobacter sp. H35-MC1]MDJ0317171.1 4-(cytidine 5'-diphospho)-2-C-methyl-D-erythritol kinase [Arthrobacter sp. H35-MC1]
MDPLNKANINTANEDEFGRDPLFAVAPRTLRVRAPGKINASFHVGPLRDDGYHGVASTYLAVSRYEEVIATTKPGTAPTDITVSISDTSSLDADALAGIPLNSGNLAVRAARLVADVAENPCGVHLEIIKHVPIAGGMGGGSADAAATLVACDALWHTGLSREELSLLGAELGADVPFALLGGAAVGLGVGDELTAALAPTPLHWVLVPAGFGLSTPVVYGRLDDLRASAGCTAVEPSHVDAEVLAALRTGDPHALAQCLHNDLQAAAESLAPSLSAVLAQGQELGALASLVSGSGPTVAFLAESSERAGELAEALAKYGHTAWAVEGPVHGAHLVP